MRAYRVSSWMVAAGFTALAACGRDVPQAKNPGAQPQSTDGGATAGSTNAGTAGTTGTTGGGTTGKRPGNTGGTTGMTSAGNTGGTAGTTGTTGSTQTPYNGTIAGLRALSGAATGLKVTIENAVVASVQGNGQIAYFADPAGGPLSGIQAELCDSAGKNCIDPGPALGSKHKLEGTFNIVTENGVTFFLSNIKLTASTESAVTLPKFPVSPDQVEKDSTTNASIRGSYVSVTGGVTVSNVTSELFKNKGYTAENEAKCLAEKKNCCTGGPKYFGFEVTGSNGKTIYVSTDNYSSKKNGNLGTKLDVWPCSGDFTKAVKVGDVLPTFAGIYDQIYRFDTKATRGQVTPTRPDDYTPAGSTTGGTSGGTSSGTTSGTTGGTSSGSTGSTSGSTGGTSSGTTSGSTGGTSAGSTSGSTGGTTAGTTSGSTGGTTGTSYAPYCQACNVDADCGTNPLDFCLMNDLGDGICGTACRFDDDCPTEAYCAAIFDENDQYVYDNCYPRSGRCE